MPKVKKPPLRAQTAAALLAALAFIGACASVVAADGGWRGAAIMAGGKGYVTTPMGQVHYRDIGPRDARVPLLLLHQTWMSLVEYAEIQDELAKLGLRSIAVDTPGYGMSDPPPGQPTVRELADNLLPVLAALRVRRVVVVGHHTGSLLAASFAAHHGERVAAVVMHGAPYFTREESEALMARGDYDFTLREDGSHFSRWYTYDFKGDPRPNTPENLRSRTWMLLSMYMMSKDTGHWAVYHYYDMERDTRAIRAPTLLLTDAHDMIHEQDERLARLRPDFTYRVFSDYTGIQMMNEPRRWAAEVAQFVAPFAK
jgi:pimeloyl-ACP methyl ester carboxylesterase